MPKVIANITEACKENLDRLSQYDGQIDRMELQDLILRNSVYIVEEDGVAAPVMEGTGME